MTSTGVPTYRVLVVDDEPRMIAMVQELLREDLAEDLRSIDFTAAEDFETAQELLTKQDFDLVVLDVRDAANGRPAAEYEARGHTLYDEIARTRWLPVVFFTGVPQQVSDLEAPPLVSVVTKNDLHRLGPAVEAGLRSGVSELRRRIVDLVETKTRLFMGEMVAPHWSEFAKAGADQDDLAMIIVNRLAVELRENALQEMGYARKEDADSSANHVPAARVYLRPTVTKHLTTTDLLLDTNGDWWIVLTPACDLYEDDPEKVAKPRTAKAQYGRVAKADRVLTGEGGSESPIIARWLESAHASKDKNMAKPAFGENQNRYRYLPGFLDIPHLLVDWENVRSVPLEDLRDEKKYRRVATLDSPFSEAMVNAYSRSVGRIGIPDIDTFGIRLELGLEKPKTPTMPKQSQGPASNSEVVRD